MDCAHAGHLAAGLDCHDEYHSTNVRPAAEEINISHLSVRVLFRNLSLDEVVLGEDIRVVCVAIRMESGESFETFIRTVVVAEPSVTQLIKCNIMVRASVTQTWETPERA